MFLFDCDVILQIHHALAITCLQSMSGKNWLYSGYTYTWLCDCTKIHKTWKYNPFASRYHRKKSATGTCECAVEKLSVAWLWGTPFKYMGKKRVIKTKRVTRIVSTRKYLGNIVLKSGSFNANQPLTSLKTTNINRRRGLSIVIFFLLFYITDLSRFRHQNCGSFVSPTGHYIKR